MSPAKVSVITDDVISMEYDYTEKVIEHFSNPRNVGEISDADGVATIGSEECGDMIKVWIKVANEYLADVKYKVFGCPAAIAACSMMTELAIGKHIDQAWELTDDHVAEALGGLPAGKYHCSNLAASALHQAIMSYVARSSVSSKTAAVTILVDDIAYGNFRSEHGLSIWIEYGNRRVLFDTGPNDAVLKNAKLLGINLKQTDAIVLSHGHYDHAGGLEAVLNIAPNAIIYLHPAALEPKFSQKNGQVREIGMSDSTKNLIGALAENGKVVWTRKPTQVFPGLFVTGRIPRNSDFEDVGGAFFVDKNCHEPDLLPDDQALVLNLPKGMVVFLGCAHAGVINTLDYVAKLSREKCTCTVIGGMHLLNTSSERIEQTIGALGQFDVQRIGMAHCTGKEAVKRFRETFPSRCFKCLAGTRVKFN